MNYGTAGFFHQSSFITIPSAENFTITLLCSNSSSVPFFSQGKVHDFFLNLIMVKDFFSAAIIATSCISSNLLFSYKCILPTHLLKINIASSNSDLSVFSKTLFYFMLCWGENAMLIFLSVPMPRVLPSLLTSLFLAQGVVPQLKGINVGPD